jgi:hypothetical protein
MDFPSTHASLFVPLQRGESSPRAWAAFHARYHEVILTWCRRRELSGACTEDLTQEIWLKYKHTYRVKQMQEKEYLDVHPGESGTHLPGRDDPEAVSD